jgi:hypothetical protein
LPDDVLLAFFVFRYSYHFFLGDLHGPYQGNNQKKCHLGQLSKLSYFFLLFYFPDMFLIMLYMNHFYMFKSLFQLFYLFLFLCYFILYRLFHLKM